MKREKEKISQAIFISIISNKKVNFSFSLNLLNFLIYQKKANDSLNLIFFLMLARAHENYNTVVL